MVGRLEVAKGSIQTGRLRVLGAARPGDQAAATLIAGATRMAGLSNAVSLLCRYGCGAQSNSLVRSMVVTALAMCWAVSKKDLGEALGPEAGELQAWMPENAIVPAPDRLEIVGLTDAEAEASDAILRRMERPAVDADPASEEALSAANRAMAAALWAMEQLWPGTRGVLPSR